MKNNHISQFSQFLRALARQQASWDGKQTTVIEPHYPVYRGKRDLLLKFCAAEVNEICKRTRRLWVVLRNGRNTNPASKLQTCRQTVHKGSVLFDRIITTTISSIYTYVRTVTCTTIVIKRQQSQRGLLCCLVGGDDAARAARSARSLTRREARTRRCSIGEVAAARLLLLLCCCAAVRRRR
jgi:hypothetical protein